MPKRSSIIVVSIFAFAAAACVGDNGQPGGDAGNDAALDAGDAATPDAAEAGPGTCVFGTSHFGDGCKFQP